MRPAGRLALLSCCLLAACGDATPDRPASAAVARDDLRIVTLSPHLAELLDAIGAADQLVGVSAYTDFPRRAVSLPVVGDAFNLDHERLALLEPNLLLAWDTGTPVHVVDELRARGYRVEVITTTRLADIPLALMRLGELTGRPGDDAAAAFRDGIAAISERHRGAADISVFYQVDARPLYTISGGHFLSELIALCGGRNVFADLDGLAPLVSVEAVLERDPEVMLANSDAGPGAFDEWDRWTGLAATRYGARFLIPADEIGRPTPRLLGGAAAVCDALDMGREKRKAYAHD